MPIAICGMLYGSMIGGIAGAVGDIVGFITKPTGDGYFFGFTISALLLDIYLVYYYIISQLH